MKSQEPTAKKRRVVCNLPIPKIPHVLGTLLVCGQGDMGQLGLGEKKMEKKRPALVQSLQDLNIVDIQAGGMHSLCLTIQGEIYSFGCNDEGALGRDTIEENSEFIPKKLSLPGKVVKISAGDSHSACLLEDGRIYAWGSFRDSHGNMGLTMEGNEPLPINLLPDIECCDIGSGGDHLVILSTDGKLYTVGCGEQGQLGRVTIRTASGESRRGKTKLLRPDLVNILKARQIDAIWATTYCTYVRKFNTNEIFAFGLNNYRQLGLKKLKHTKESVFCPMQSKFDNVKIIAGGQHHALLLTKDLRCYAIGRKDYGRLGLGKKLTDNVTELLEIKFLTGKEITFIACGEAQSFAITSNGSLYAWGMGTNLQLGTGTEDDAEEPTIIPSNQIKDKIFFKVASGGQHTLFLIKKDNQSVPKEIAAKEKIVSSEVESKKEMPVKSEVESKNKSSGMIFNQGERSEKSEEILKLNVTEETEEDTATSTKEAKRGRKRKR